MKGIDGFIAATLKGFLVVFGLATCGAVLMAISPDLANRVLFSGTFDFTPISEPALRHWGIMVFGIGVLMIAAAFSPWLQFSTMLYSTIEKAFMVLLYLINRNQSWGSAYFTMFTLDGIIVLYSLVYFVSSYGQPQSWGPVPREGRR